MRDTSTRRLHADRRAIVITTLLTAVTAMTACDRSPLPTAPAPELDAPASEPGATGTSPGELLSDRAHVIRPEQFTLLSTASETAAGHYRYRAAEGAALPTIGRDDYLVGRDDAPFVRVVLSSEVVGDELLVETGPARWSDVVNSGTYGVTMPLSAQPGPAVTFAGEAVNPVGFGPSPAALPSLEHVFPRTDVCQMINDVLARLPGPGDHPPEVCGQERNIEIGAGVVLSVSGTIDSIVILSGRVSVTGDMEIGATIDRGGVVGGRAPTFAPCNRAAYRGCLTTPTGALLVEWLRRYAPSVPEASLSPVRVCVPGTPVRVRAGYWSRTGFRVTWVNPVYERCRISDTGELPTVVLPSVKEVRSILRPRLDGELTLKVQGDGTMGLKIGIPSASAATAYQVGNHFTAKLALGLFVETKLSLLNGGATVKFTFDDAGVATQVWTETTGWTGGFQPTTTENHAQLLELVNPDSVIVRVSVPLEAEATFCMAIISCETTDATDSTKQQSEILAIGVEANVGISIFEEAVWSRPAVHAGDPLIDNWNIDVDAAYDLSLGAGVKIPLSGFLIPKVPLEWEEVFECCRVSLGDLWGRGHLRVETSTIGAYADPDGYQVLVSRYDTMPVLIEEGARRLGTARDHGSPLELAIPASGVAVFSPSIAPCAVWYSDALFSGNPAWGLAVQGMRTVGVGIPTYAVTAFCDLVIARHVVTLTGVSENCIVTGGATRDAVWLRQRDIIAQQSDTTTVAFDIVCDGVAPLGDLVLTTAAAALPETVADYAITIDGVPWGLIGPAESLTLTGLRAGTRSVALTGGPSNCIAPAAATVVVPAAGVVALTMRPICSVPAEGRGNVTIRATTSGEAFDLDGFQVKLDGVLRAAMTVNGSATVSGVPALLPSVLHVTNIAGNCRATSPTPFVVMLDANATARTLPFTASCTPSPIDTVRGVIETSIAPALAVAVRSADGALRTLTGASRVDLAQLDGTAVDVWGVTSGTSLDVYGFEIRSSLADPRWMGIVAVRGEEVWLFGEEALRLMEVPPGIIANEGALLWISGTRSGDDVRPAAFGVIREALP